MTDSWMKMGSNVMSGSMRSVAIPVLETEWPSRFFGQGHDNTSKKRLIDSSNTRCCCCDEAAVKEFPR